MTNMLTSPANSFSESHDGRGGNREYTKLVSILLKQKKWHKVSLHHILGK